MAVVDIYPLSPLQEGMLFHALHDRSSNFYFEQTSYRLEGRLNIDCLEESLYLLFQRHSILRTAFIYEEVDRPLQVILDDRKPEFCYQDIRLLAEDAKEAFVEEFTVSDRSRSFDLRKDVLMRVAILQLDDTSYEFIWSHHHILMDGWCMQIIIPEFQEIYQALCQGKEPWLPDVKPYSEYIQWLEIQDKNASNLYWSNYLSGYNQNTSGIPKKNEAPENAILANVEVTVDLGEAKTALISSLSKVYNITINNLFEVLWGILLSRYTGSRDVVYGRVVSGRPSELEGVERMVGLFINTIPVRIRYEEDQEVASLLRQVQEASVEGHRYHYHSLAEIQATTELGSHLINHILAFQNVTNDYQALVGDKESRLEAFSEVKIADISLFEQTSYDFSMMVHVDDMLRVKFTYNSCIYDGWMVEQVWAHFVFLIDQVLEDAHLPIRDLRWLTPQDEQLLETFNGPWVDYPQDQTMVSLFEAQSARTSEGIALVYEDRAWSYAELNARSNQLAHYLRDRYAIQADDLLGLSMRRSDWMIVSILGILKSGAGYVPIDVGYPLARQQYMVNDSGMKGLLTDGPVSEGLEELVSWVDVRQLGWEGYSQENPERIAGPQDIAYVIYTSGTTGYPKGTPILHSSNVNMSLSQVQQFRLTPSDRVAQFASISFDASVYEIFMNFYAGAGLVVFSEDHLREPRQFLRYLRAQGVSVVTLPPAYLSTLPVEDLGFLRVIITAGESADVFQASYLSGQVEYYNAYGPTECAVCVTTYQVQPEDRDRRRIPIGRPIANMRVDIMDEQLRRVPVGVPGEICVSGVGLSPGYLGQAALTATRFVSDSSVVGGRLYRTGDVGRWDREGYIEYLGRMDDQIKLRGYRIELGEIEQVLGIHPEVGGSVVVVSGEGEQRYLTGYYTSPSGVGTEELRVYLSHSLPAYMVPTYLIRLDSFPLTASGKIDKKQLPHPVDMAEGAQCYTAPQTPLQQQLVAIWEALLGHSPVGIDDNFFELGGHSLRAIRLVSRLGRDIGKSVGVGEIFRHPTIRMLSERLAGEPTVVTAAIPRAGEASSYPLSHAQQRLWLIEQLEGESVAYNIFGVYKLRGEVSMVGMAEAFRRVVDRHESLRTRLITEEGAPRQQVVSVDEIGYQFDYQDLRSMTDAEQVLQQLVEEEGSSRFDLGTGPLLRTKLVRLGEEQYYFLLSLHHIIADGWSMEVLVREVLQYYQGYIEGQGVELPPLAIQYKDYAVWQRQALQETSYQSARRYWLEQLGGGLPMLELPTDYRRGEVRSQRGATVSYDLDRELYERIRRLSQQAGTSLFMTLLSGVKVLLYRYTGQGDMVVGSPIAGRDHYALEDQIGFYVNTLVLRTQLGGENTFWQVLQQVKERTLEAYVHQHYPFDQLVQELGAGRDRSRTPLFDVMVVLQNGDMSGEEFPGLEVDSYPVESGVSKFDLTFTFYEGGEGLQLSVNYNTDLYQEERIERLMGHYAELMRSVTEQVHEKINKIDYLGEAERVQLLETFNGPWVDYPQDQTMVSLFEAQSARTSEGIALVYEDRAWSYAELNARSNQLAHYLRDRYAIQADDLLGLSMRRSDWMIVSILGILKSGAGYVPIDVGYPLARQQYMVNDSGMKGLLTDGPVSEGLEELVSWVDVRQLGWEGYSQENPERIAGPQDIAYVIYTSGSTGQPKACLIEHKNVVSLLKNNRNKFDFDETDVWIMAHSYCFDFSVWEMYGALLNGGKLIVPTAETVRDVKLLYQTILRFGITVLNQTPGAFYNLTAEDQHHSDKKLSSLRYIIFGGDKLTPEYLINWVKRYPLDQVRLINMYGITEATVHVTYHPIDTEDLVQPSFSSPIGKPLPGVQIYVLDMNQQPVGIGVTGEIYVGGNGVSRGYLNNKLLNQAKFLENILPGKRLYHTGDLGCWQSDGSLQYKGRVDSQVKVRGYRIELGEIEEAMRSYDAVDSAIVLQKRNEKNNYLVGYYRGTDTVNVKRFKRYLSNQLPSYMVPTYLISLEAFPLTDNGKIDYANLPDPVQLGIGQSEYVEPKSELQKQLVAIWEEVLDRKKIGVEDHFLAIGGDSIKAIQVIAKINERFHTSLNVRDIFFHKTIHPLSHALEKLQVEKQPSGWQEAADRIEQLKQQAIEGGVVSDDYLQTVTDFFPMSDIQKAMLYHSILNSQSSVYFDQMFFQFEDLHFDIDRFKLAFELMVEKHAILRTSFLFKDRYELQFEHRSIPVGDHLVLHDFSHLILSKQIESIESYLNEDRKTPFQPEVPGLWRVAVFGLSDQEYGVLFSCHHAIVDGWSDASLRTELSNIYYALKHDPYFQPKVLQSGYRDYVLEELSFKNRPEEYEYWQNYLEGFEKTPLPFHKSVDAVGEHELLAYGIELDRDLYENLRCVAEEMQVSPKAIFLGALCQLIRMTSNAEEVLIGLVTNSRPSVTDGDKIIGCFLNTVPFRVTDFMETNRQYLKQIEQALIDSKQHDKLSLLEILQTVGEKPQRAGGLFDILFNYVDFNIYAEVHELAEVKTAIVSGHTRNEVPVNFTISKSEVSVNVSIEYPSSVFDRPSVERLISYYTEILNSYVTQTDRKLNFASIISREEAEVLIQHFNNTDVPFDREATLHTLFEKQATQTPDAVALVCGEVVLTYQEVNEQSQRICEYLWARHKVTPGELVGLYMEPSEWMIIAVMGILKTGAGYVPVDMGFPLERIEYIISDSGMSCLLTTSDPPIDFTVETVNLRSDWVQVLTYQDSMEPAEVHDPGNTAYVIYTSGSTGKPKGCVLRHEGVVNRIAWMQRQYAFGREDIVLQRTPMVFDVSVWEIFMTLCYGAKLVLVDKEVTYDPKLICEKIISHRVSMVHLVPALLNAVLDFLDKNSIVKVASLKHVIASGEVLSANTVEKFYDHFSDTLLHNLYGPTEASVDVLHYTTRQGDPVVPIGKPIDNTHIYLLDASTNLVPLGTPGEICISGVGLAMGYLNNEELTMEKFVFNPYETGGMLYRTGDIGRWNSEGDVEYLGRMDTQVKLRGFRIELAEIEHVVCSINAIESALALIGGEGDDKYLVCYYKSDLEVDEHQLKQAVRIKLPYYMVPTYFVHLYEYPLMVSGKIDRKALPDPEKVAFTQSDYVMPETPIEQALAQIWSNILSTENIGLHDDFFELGGHSIKAIRVVSSISEQFNKRIEISDIFTNSHLRDLATLIANLQEVEGIEIHPASITTDYPLSYAQKRLWWLSQLEQSQQTVLNISGGGKLQGDISYEALESALQHLIVRHESLRTVFIQKQGEPRQVILDPDAVDFKIVLDDISQYPKQDEHIEQRLSEAERQAFDLSSGPLVKVLLIKTSESEHIVILSIHHIICDGWSMEVFMNELELLYVNELRGEAIRLEPLRIQYKDYACWQNNLMSQPYFSEHKAFWNHQFMDEIELLKLPYDDPIKASSSDGDGHSIHFSFAEEIANRIGNICRHSSSTPFAFLLTLVKVLLFRYTGIRDIIVGTPVAGRKYADLKNQIGFYINLLAIRTVIEPTDTFKKLFDRINTHLHKIFKYEEYPYAKVVEEVKSRHNLTTSELFNVLVQVDYVNTNDHRKGELSAISFDSLHHERLTSKYPITFFFLVDHEDNSISCTIEYRTDLFSASTINQLKTDLLNIAVAVTTDSQQSISASDLIDSSSEEEELQVFTRSLDELH